MKLRLEKPTELKQKAVKGLIWSGAQIWGGQIISFVVILVLAHLLEPKAFGLLAYASVFISFIQIFVDQGFGDAIVQRTQIESGYLDTAFWTNLLSGIILTILCFAFSEHIGDLFQEPQITSILHWLSISFFLLGLSGVQQSILRRELAFKQLAIRSLISSITGGIVGIIFAAMGFGVWSLVAQNLTNNSVGVIVLWNISSWRPRFAFSRNGFRDLFAFGSNIVGINILNFINRHADDFLIGYFLGPSALGFYTIAYKLLLTLTKALTGVTNAVAFPAFSRIKDEPERMRSIFCQAIRYTSLISFPIFIGIAILSSELIPAIFGPNWYSSIPVMQALAFIGVLHSVFYYNASAVLASGKPSWRLGVTLVSGVSNIIAFGVAVRYGIVAVAVAYVIRGYVLAPLEIWVVKKAIGLNIKIYLRQFYVPLVASITMVFVIMGLKYFLNKTLVYQLIIPILVGGSVYICIVQFIMPTIRQQVTNLLWILLPKWFQKRA